MTTKHLTRQLVKRGLEVRPGGKHLKVTCPDGTFVIVPSTPSDHRAVKKIAAELRRHGACVHWKHLL